MPTTIGRNRRQYLINVQTEFTECHRYNPETGKMDACNPEEAWDLLLDMDNKAARLIESDSRDFYTIRAGNQVYELRKPSR